MTSLRRPLSERAHMRLRGWASVAACYGALSAFALLVLLNGEESSLAWVVWWALSAVVGLLGAVVCAVGATVADELPGS